MLATFALAAACSTDAPLPLRQACGLVVWHQGASPQARVFVRGSWDGFASPGVELRRREGPWFAALVPVAPGPVAWSVVEDGVPQPPSPWIGTTSFVDGREVSWLTIADCQAPALRIVSTGSAANDGTDAASARIGVDFVAATDGAGLDPRSLGLTDEDGGALSVTTTGDALGASVVTSALAPGKHRLRLRARDARGREASVPVTLWAEPERWTGVPLSAASAPSRINARDPRDLVLYQVILDRFRGEDGAPLSPLADPQARAGGRIAGLRRAIESGELPGLGFNALWISPLYRGPDGAFLDVSGRASTGYHGYWPTAAREVEPRLGTDADVDALMAAAHGRGLRVLLDVVPNHVHRDHPYAAKLREGWFNHPDGDCVCGSPSCPWGVAIETCWFTPFLPDLDWRDDDVAATLTEDVGYWMERFGFDGLRIDAVPMMPRAAIRRIADAVRTRFDHAGHRSLLLGENFVGPADFDALRYYLGPLGLDGEFHFPLLWMLRITLAQGYGTLENLASVVENGEASWRGSGAIMGTTLGNHDVARFITVAAGDDGASSFEPAPTPTDPRAYAKLALAFAAIYALPGVPVVYYGDEVALAGRGDPDNRRVHPAAETLRAEALAVRDVVARLGALRACSTALRRGAYRTLSAGNEHYVLAREAGDDLVVVALQRARLDSALPSLRALLGDRAASLVSALRIDFDAARGPIVAPPQNAPAALAPAALSAQFFVLRGSPCAP